MLAVLVGAGVGANAAVERWDEVPPETMRSPPQ